MTKEDIANLDQPGGAKILNDAITYWLCIGLNKGTALMIKAHVRDFLAQKFEVAYIIAETPEEMERLHAL
jgi:hypothetical protein